MCIRDRYYLNDRGQIIKGNHIINGAQVYFDENGVQIKGNFDKDNRYYDEHTGKLCLLYTSIVLVSRLKETLLKTIHFTIKIVVPALRNNLSI